MHSDYASDRRYPDRNEEVMFYPFPKPKKNFDKCRIKKKYFCSMVNCYRTSRNLRHVAMILTDQIFVKESLRISTRNERNHHSIYLTTCEFWRQLKPISLYLYRMTFTILHNKSNNKFHWQSFIIHNTRQLD